MKEMTFHLARTSFAKMLNRIGLLFDAISHGDEEHRAWLKQAIKDHMMGKKVKIENQKDR